MTGALLGFCTRGTKIRDDTLATLELGSGVGLDSGFEFCCGVRCLSQLNLSVSCVTNFCFTLAVSGLCYDDFYGTFILFCKCAYFHT